MPWIATHSTPFITQLLRHFSGRLSRRLAQALVMAPLLADTACGRSFIFYKSEPIQQEIDQIRSTIKTLPHITAHPSPWTIGYASSWNDLPESPLTIEIRFPKDAVVDLIALLPATYSDSLNIKQNFGFPIRFSIERILPDETLQMVANHLETDYAAGEVSPELFPCPSPTLTRGLKITVTKRPPNHTWWPTSHAIALSEVLAFSGERNVALHSQVSTSSSQEIGSHWSRDCLTDGFFIYSQTDYKLRDPSPSFRALEEEVQLFMDLGNESAVDEIRLWPVVRSIQSNNPLSIGIGFPRSVRVELSKNPDFSDSTTIYQIKDNTQQVGGGAWMQHTTPATGRYVQITLQNGVRGNTGKNHPEIQLGELELLQNGRVISRAKPIVAANNQTEGLALLNDGLVAEGRILPLRQWVTQFRLSRTLTQQLKELWPLATEARSLDERRSWTILLIATGLIMLLLQAVIVVRIRGRRRWSQMRERIACDLHDEIGANVSSIAHTAELLRETVLDPSPTQARLLSNLIESANLTTRETKHFLRFIDCEAQNVDLTEQFVLVANRILGTIPATFRIQNQRSFNALDPASQWNVLFFYKEALNNIIKHSGASAVEVHTQRIGRQFLLKISDNGQGKSEVTGDYRHLKSRAKLLRGEVQVLSSPADGTHVTLIFNKSITAI